MKHSSKEQDGPKTIGFLPGHPLLLHVVGDDGMNDAGKVLAHWMAKAAAHMGGETRFFVVAANKEAVVPMSGDRTHTANMTAVNASPISDDLYDVIRRHASRRNAGGSSRGDAHGASPMFQYLMEAQGLPPGLHVFSAAGVPGISEPVAEPPSAEKAVAPPNGGVDVKAVLTGAAEVFGAFVGGALAGRSRSKKK